MLNTLNTTLWLSWTGVIYSELSISRGNFSVKNASHNTYVSPLRMRNGVPFRSSISISTPLCGYSAVCKTVLLQWRHNTHDDVSNHQPRDCLLNRLFRRISKKTSKLRVTGLCEGNSPVTGEFPAQMASNAENVSIWWRHRVYWIPLYRESAAIATQWNKRLIVINSGWSWDNVTENMELS